MYLTHACQRRISGQKVALNQPLTPANSADTYKKIQFKEMPSYPKASMS